MRQKDLPVLVAIIIFSAIFSVFFTKFLIIPKNIKSQPIEKVDVISADFQKTDETIFNRDAVNPTQLIKIGNNNAPSSQ